MGQALVTIVEKNSSAYPMLRQQGINMDRRRLEMTVLMTSVVDRRREARQRTAWIPSRISVVATCA